MFEIHVGELRATFLRNHNMRCHKDPSRRQPKQKTTQAQQTEDPQARNTTQAEDNSSTEDPRRIPGSGPTRSRITATIKRVQVSGRSSQPPQARGRCTRYGALHPLRGGAPEQKRCNAYSSGAAPQQTRTNAELARRTTHRHTPPCAAGPYWRQDGHAAHAAHAATCTPAHSDPLRPTPTPPTPLHAKSPLTCAQVGPERHLTGRRRDLWERTRPPMPQHLELPPPTCSV